jgi:tryptophan-rich hypothetical protein
MSAVNPKKLLHSKWTAVAPEHGEKHFLVIEVRPGPDGTPKRCILEAVHSNRQIELGWRELKDTSRWRIGWQ